MFRPKMQGPGLGEASQGAVAGAVVGATGGLFAAGLARAIIGHSPALLLDTPRVNMICWFISLLLGWLIGGQLGPRLGQKFNSLRVEIVAGGIGGLIPVLAIALWGWYMVTPH